MNMKIVRFKDGFCLETTDEQAYELVKAIQRSQAKSVFEAFFELEDSKEGFSYMVRVDEVQCVFSPDQAKKIISFKDV